MDFGFSPGPPRDSHLADLRTMFTLRANTKLIAGSVTSVRGFIQHLNGTNAITKPVGDLLLGTHANDEGQLSIPMFPGQSEWTKFETLEKAISDTSKSIAIPDPLIGFTTGNSITHAVHLKGCNVGLAQPFLAKLKQALGGNVNVTAPKFFHGATTEPQGSFEYMGYQFALPRTELFLKPGTRTPDRPKALAEFDAKQFKLINNNVVPTADWDKLIPPNPNVEKREQVTSQLGQTFGKRTTIHTPRQYRVERIPFGPWTVPYPSPGAVPSSKTQQLQDLENHLQTDARFQSSHPYPQYEREGFADISAFVAGYNWNCRKSGASLVCNGTRFLFVFVIAVTDPATVPATGIFADGNLIFNFYPASGTGLTAITNVFQVTDPKWFATV
jgi:hypothetical protein